MPKINVYLPDGLATEVKARSISVSRIAQQALREEVERMRAIEQNIPESRDDSYGLPDILTAAERIVATARIMLAGSVKHE